MLFHEEASSAEPVVIDPAAGPGSAYGPCGEPQPSVSLPAAAAELEEAGPLPVPLLPGPLLPVPALADPLLAESPVEAPLLGALPVAAGALDELDDSLDELDELDDEFWPGELEQAANNSPDAATRAVSLTARVLVMKDPPRSAS